uniref:F-box domain-containing protein n=1 Tax=Clastoptera arizonana TaxID=38151 RepID=A0A1B6DQM9_9HEMI
MDTLKEMPIFPSIQFSTLPLELIEHITSYLSINDLLSCSLVSVGWREALNHDIIWLKRCRGGYEWKCYGNHLKNLKSHVEPIFELPQTSEQSLDPLCVWRVYFMTQKYFKMNMQRSRYKKYFVNGHFNTDMALYYDAENVVVIQAELNKFEIWNTEGLPFCHDVICGAFVTTDQHLYANDNYVVILQNNLLQVYEQCGRKYELIHRKLFNQSNIFSLNIPLNADLTQWYFEVFNTSLNNQKIHNVTKHVFFDNIFIGFSQETDLKNCVFHVWDFEKGIKLKEQTFIKSSNIFIDIQFYKSDLLYIVFETSDSNLKKETIVSCYDVSSLNYTSLIVHIDCSLLDRYFYFNSKFMVTLHSNCINVWNFSKNTMNKFEDTTTKPFPFTFIIFEKRLIYAGNGECSNHLKFLDLETLEIHKTIVFRFPIYRLMFAKPNLLLVKSNTRGTQEYEVTIWNLIDNLMDCNRDCVIHTFKFEEQFSGTLKFSKLISIQPNQFSIVHFW